MQVAYQQEALDESFFYLYAAQLFGHVRAKSMYATLYLQNGLLPSKSILKHYLGVEKLSTAPSPAFGKFRLLHALSPTLATLIDSDVDMTQETFVR